MLEILRNIATKAKWFFGALIILGIIWANVDPSAFYGLVNSLIRLGGQMFQVVLAGALAVVGIKVIFGHRPWWLGGGGGKKKKRR